MANTSKKILVQNLWNSLAWDLINVNSEDSEDEILEDFSTDLLALENQRYLAERKPVVKSFALIEQLLPNYDDRRFRAVARMSKANFGMLLDLIQDHTVFHTSMAQYPVSLQLLVALNRFGTFGNSASLITLGRTFGIGDGGTLNIFTKRVISAILSKEKDYITWPTTAERENFTEHMRQQRMPFCIGFVDGTHVALAKAPTDDPISYYNRNKYYSFNLQLVVDPFKRIRAYHVGQPGKVHDAKVFSLMGLCKEPTLYFGDHEYIIGDQAYGLTSSVITPFRRAQNLSKNHQRFNAHLSSKRIAVEHANGGLKSRFQSLLGCE